MPALGLACIASDDAFAQPKRAQERLDAVAAAQGVALGGPRLVRMMRDPRASLTDPAPRACRPVDDRARIAAPLYREREPAASWLLVTPGNKGIVDDTARLLRECKALKRVGLLPPRAILDDDGHTLALALPIGS